MRSKTRPKISKFRFALKVLIVLFITLILLFLLITLLSLISQKMNPPAKNLIFGVTFSQPGAISLQLDWQKTYLEILDDLKVRNLRLGSYWPIVEPTRGQFDFSQNDFLLGEAQKRGAKVILTVGVKQPRWPECFVPGWVRPLSTKERQNATLNYMQKVIERYKGNPAIVAWQVENEPYLYPYGDNCYPPDSKFIEQQINLVRSLDKKPVIISDSGELTIWANQMALSDIFGTTLYRTVWNPVTHYMTYPVTPGFYSLKSNFFRKFFAPKNQKTIVIELQAEPWIPNNNPINTPLETQMNIFSPQDLGDNVEFAKKTSFDEIYLWGVEWWYYMKEHNEPAYWDFAKTLF